MWVVVHFVDENTVEAVPESWLLNQEECFWPPYAGNRLSAAIASCEQPSSEKWDVHKVRMLSLGNNYESLLQAKAKARQAQDTSDINSECDLLDVKRKRRKPLISSSDEESEFQSGPLVSLPPAPGIMQKHRAKMPRSQLCQSKVLLQHTSAASPSCKNRMGLMDCGKKSATSSIASDNELSGIVTPPLSRSSSKTTYSIQENDTPKTKQGTEFNEAFRQILRQLHIMSARLDQMNVDINLFTEKFETANLTNNSNNDGGDVFTQFMFPLNTIEDFIQFEEYLSMPAKFNSSVNDICKIGGNTAYDCTRRYLSRLITNNVAAQYSWMGKKKKLVFGTTNTARLVILSINKNTKTKNVTAKECEEAIKSWLRRAKERMAAKCTMNETVLGV